MAEYHYISSPDFVQQLKFDYVETYSFQRTAELQEFFALIKIKQRGFQLISEQEKRLDVLSSYPKEEGLLIDEKGEFSSSSNHIRTFEKGAPELEQLLAILAMPPIEIPSWICAPFYRDAVVFYDNTGTILSCLNICFSCEYMQTKKFHFVDADEKVYDALKAFFIGIGHPVERD